MAGQLPKGISNAVRGAKMLEQINKEIVANRRRPLAEIGQIGTRLTKKAVAQKTRGSRTTTGQLGRSVNYVVDPSSSPEWVDVGSTAKHAPFFERGTKAHGIKPKKKKVLAARVGFGGRKVSPEYKPLVDKLRSRAIKAAMDRGASRRAAKRQAMKTIPKRIPGRGGWWVLMMKVRHPGAKAYKPFEIAHKATTRRATDVMEAYGKTIIAQNVPINQGGA